MLRNLYTFNRAMATMYCTVISMTNEGGGGVTIQNQPHDSGTSPGESEEVSSEKQEKEPSLFACNQIGDDQSDFSIDDSQIH